MEKKSEKYYVKIHPDFLFKVNFKSDITKCLFVYIKLEHNYQLQQNQTFKLNANELAKFFGVEVTTIYRSIKELVERGFLEKNGRDKYKLVNENMNLEKAHQFIRINKNFFIDMFENLKLQSKEIPKALQVYYYLTFENGQYALAFNKMESNISQSEICKALRLNNTTVKKLTGALRDVNLISKEDGKTYTHKEFKQPHKIVEKIGQLEDN